MPSLRVLVLVLFAALACPAWFSPAAAQGYDPEAPCGRDQQGYPLQCTRPDPSVTLESTCLTTARVEICVRYHQNACQIRGFAVACRLFALGRNCFGGDRRTCEYYVSLLRANTACTLDRDPRACQDLRQQGFL